MQPGAQPPDPLVEAVVWDFLIPPLEPSSETIFGKKILIIKLNKAKLSATKPSKAKQI